MKVNKFLYLLIFIIIIIIPFINSAFGNKLIQFGTYSDTYSDANVMMAGNHFSDYGFRKLYFLPTKGPKSIEKPYEFYTHYPPLPDLINGIFKSLGINQIWFYKTFSFFISLLGLYFLFLLLDKFFNRTISLLTVLLIIISPTFIFYSVSVHQHSYNWFFRFGAILLLNFYIEKKQYKTLYLFFLWLFLFLNSINSFEFIIYLQVFIFLYLILFTQFPIIQQLKVNLITISAPIMGFFIHMLQNTFAIGLKKTFFDIFNALIYRTTGINKTEIDVIPINFLTGLKSILIKFFYSFAEPGKIGIYLVLTCLFVYTILIKNKKIKKAQLKILIIFLFSSFTWPIFLFQHASIHFHIINHFIPIPQITIATLLYNAFFIRNKNQLMFYTSIINFLLYFYFSINSVIYYRNSSTNWSNFDKYDNLIRKNGYFYSNRYKPQLTYFTNRWPKVIINKDSLNTIPKGGVFFMDTLYNEANFDQLNLDSTSQFLEKINNYKIYKF